MEYTKMDGLNPAIFETLFLLYNFDVYGQDVWNYTQTYYIDNGGAIVIILTLPETM
jgi:hypothetical protein